MEMAKKHGQTAETWIDAAYEQFTEAGLSSVKVETVAKRLGATKGSFYWHFENRKTLIDAVMDRWEQVTEQIIDVAERGGTATARLDALFTAVAESTIRPSGEATLYIEAAAEGVQHIVTRVSDRRTNYIADILVDLGFDREEAVRRGIIATAAVIGIEQLSIGAGRHPSVGRELTRTALNLTLSHNRE